MAVISEAQDITGPTDASGFISVQLTNANPTWWLVTPVSPNTGTHPFIAASAAVGVVLLLIFASAWMAANPEDDDE